MLILWVTPAIASEESWQALNSEVVSLHHQGRYLQALPLAKEALRVAEATMESDHPYLTTSLNNLGAVYQSLGQYEAAEVLYRQTLEIEERVLGEDHPRVAMTRNNLEELLKAKRHSAFAEARGILPPTGEETPADGDSSYRDFEREQTPSRWIETDVSFSTGFRYDDFKWNIAGNKGGQEPNILSELTWRKLQSYEVRGDGRLTIPRIITFRGSYAHSWIYRGQNQDSDYLGDNRTFEFSRSNNSSDRGTLLDATAGVGYPWRPASGVYDLTLSFLGGYSYHEQNLTITNGYQTIPRTGYFSGYLNSEYQARWRGPWTGVDLSFKPKEKVTLFGTFEYHWASYRADARWNLRSDFSQPKSFRHTADGTGVVGSLGVSYLFRKSWSLYAEAKAQNWSTEPGIDVTFKSNGKTAETRLNKVKWDSVEVRLGSRCLF